LISFLLFCLFKKSFIGFLNPAKVYQLNFSCVALLYCIKKSSVQLQTFLPFSSQLRVDKKAGNTFIFVSIPDGYCQKVSYRNYFDLRALSFKGIVSQTMSSSNTLFSIFS